LIAYAFRDQRETAGRVLRADEPPGEDPPRVRRFMTEHRLRRAGSSFHRTTLKRRFNCSRDTFAAFRGQGKTRGHGRYDALARAQNASRHASTVHSKRYFLSLSFPFFPLPPPSPRPCPSSLSPGRIEAATGNWRRSCAVPVLKVSKSAPSIGRRSAPIKIQSR